MTKEEKIKLLDEWEQRLRELHLRFDLLCVQSGHLEGPFADAIWRVTTAYTKAVAIAVGDTGGDGKHHDSWCEWYEEMMILSGYEIGIVTMPDGAEFNVESVADLVEVIG